MEYITQHARTLQRSKNMPDKGTIREVSCEERHSVR